jgi:hypothetical protein
MSMIQPGDGYTFSASSSGYSLDVIKPWTPPQDTGIMIGVALPKFPPFPDINGSPFSFSDIVQQFQVETVIVGVNQYVRVAKGAVNFTVSNMPEVWKGAVSDVRQAWIHGVAVRPGVTVVNGGDPSSPWMEDGGYYQLPSTGTYFITISKLDIAGSISDSTLLQQNVPFVSIFSADSDLYDKIFSETGPSQYVNQTNVQKMQGYDAESTGLSGDFGNCHTTWFLPVKWGYACKLIAVVETVTPTVTAPTIEVAHAATATNNEVHRITIPPEAKKIGSFQLGYEPGFFNSTQTDPFDPFNPLNSGNLTGQFQWNLSNALKKIEELRGNSSVTVSGQNTLDVTYINEYANTAVPLPDIINNTIGVPTSTYDVMQHVIGSIDLSIGLNFLGTSLMNVPDWVESEDDPYNTYETENWEPICNHDQKEAIEGIAAANLAYYNLVISPFDWTSANYSWTTPGSCIPEPNSDHPFKVKHVSTTGGLSTYSIVSGTVNNLVPGNIASTITVSTSTYEVWVKAPFAGGTFPATSGLEWNMGTPVPSDTDAEGYIRVATVNGSTVTQYVTGSLWADRIKLGTQTATYYYARI